MSSSSIFPPHLPSNRLTNLNREEIFRSFVVLQNGISAVRNEEENLRRLSDGNRRRSVTRTTRRSADEQNETNHSHRNIESTFYLLRLSVSLKAESLIDDSPSVSLRSRCVRWRRRDDFRWKAFVVEGNCVGSSRISSNSV